ncbi:MAG: indolepyruvate oxidoreductase subunit beta [Candidatus Hydrogenedentes bacterium]|nr:indolepyruvate oxidoreductase subunit beta [Candidatus Hydrogenedentota bacterium]
MSRVTNIVLAGLGGQGVIRASEILAEVLFRAGYDVKQSEIHGMSQRGGSVSSDLRFGDRVFSPMVPPGEADYLLILDASQQENNLHRLKPGGVLINPATVLREVYDDVEELDHDDETPLTRKNFNVALLGVLSSYLDIEETTWIAAIESKLPEKLHAQNREVFALGRGVLAR